MHRRAALALQSIIRNPGILLLEFARFYDLTCFDIHNPPTVNNISAYITVGLRIAKPELIAKDIRLPLALRKIFRSERYVSGRQNLPYSFFGIRWWKYNDAPKCD